MQAELTEQILNLPSGAHLCLFYDRDPLEEMPALISFIQDGLSKKEQFVYVADDHTIDQLAAELKHHEIDVENETANGRLKLLTREQWRQPDELNTEEKFQQLQNLIQQAIEAGFKGIRFAIEMTWMLGPEINARKLERWEAAINKLFARNFPGRIICQYNRSQLAPEALLAALHIHPYAIIGPEICSNVFCHDTPVLKGHSHLDASGKDISSDAKQVDWMISQLKQSRVAERRMNDQLHRELEKRKESDYARERLAAIVDSSDDAIISKDLNGFIMSWNAAAERLFGYTAEEIIGKHITILFPPDRYGEEADILARIRRGESLSHHQTIRLHKNGKPIEISLSTSPIKDSEGNIVGASKIARDISEYKQAERAIKEANEKLLRINDELEARVAERTASLREALSQMEEFSYSVSHDLRAPVRAMQGFAKVLMEDFSEQLGPQGVDYLQRIMRAGVRMDRLIQEVLTFSRLARAEIHLQPVCLDRLLPDIAHAYPQLQPPNAEIIIQHPLLEVQGHEPSLTQALSNLLNNGVKFVAPGVKPRIRVWTERVGDNVRLWVEDNGIGIKPEHQTRLFGLFQRIHGETKYEGTGIGLAIVRKAMERMGGKAGCISDGVSGSKFWIELKAA
jgi:PAS domain S-box-containing protein